MLTKKVLTLDSLWAVNLLDPNVKPFGVQSERRWNCLALRTNVVQIVWRSEGTYVKLFGVQNERRVKPFGV